MPVYVPAAGRLVGRRIVEQQLNRPLPLRPCRIEVDAARRELGHGRRVRKLAFDLGWHGLRLAPGLHRRGLCGCRAGRPTARRLRRIRRSRYSCTCRVYPPRRPSQSPSEVQRASHRPLRRPRIARARTARFLSAGRPRGSRRRPRARSVHPQGPPREPGAACRPRHRPHGRPRHAGIVATGLGRGGRDPIHACARDPPGLHGRARRRRPRRDARRDGGARRRSAPGQPAQCPPIS